MIGNFEDNDPTESRITECKTLQSWQAITWLVLVNQI